MRAPAESASAWSSREEPLASSHRVRFFLELQPGLGALSANILLHLSVVALARHTVGVADRVVLARALARAQLPSMTNRHLFDVMRFDTIAQ